MLRSKGFLVLFLLALQLGISLGYGGIIWNIPRVDKHVRSKQKARQNINRAASIVHAAQTPNRAQGRNTHVGQNPAVPDDARINPEQNHGDPATPPAVGAAPCTTAQQWEGRATEWDHLLGVNNRFNITYDGTNRRKRIMEDKHAQLPGRRIYEYIMLFEEGIQYVINHNYNNCTVEKLGTWRNFSIPPGSTLEDHYEIGAPGNGFMVQEWSDRIPGRKKENWIGTFTDTGCWPVNEIFMERDENLTVIQSVTTKFFDLQVGIKNMSVFTPPSICNGPHPTPTPKLQAAEGPPGPTLGSQIQQWLRSIGFDF